MAQFHSALTAALCTFIQSQRVFFVASAPRTGRVNVSPKGLETFRILSPNRVGYLDVTGSGNETAAHLLENGRATFMFCAFEGAPMILRVYGHGSAIHPHDEDWPTLRPLFGPPLAGERQLIVVDIESVQTSCGFGVPLFDYEGQRTLLPEKAARRGEAGVAAYQAEKNLRSIDGLPTGLVL
jgi:hypothetical protein